jgi:outer membrane protein
MEPDVSSERLVVAPIGAAFEMSSDFRPAVSFTYFVADRVGLSASTAWPFSYNLYLRDASGRSRGGQIHASPFSLTLQYYLPKVGRLKPWLGVGGSYTHFTREKTGGVLRASADSVQMSSATGWAAEAGFDWDLKRDIWLSFAVQQTQAESEVRLSKAGVRVDKVKMNFDPLVWSIGVMRRF